MFRSAEGCVAGFISIVADKHRKAYFPCLTLPGINWFKIMDEVFEKIFFPQVSLVPFILGRITQSKQNERNS